MFCDNCGYQIAEGQRFCGGCGKPAGIAQVRASDGRVARHVQLVAILWLAAGFLNLVATAVLFVIANGLFGHGTGVPPGWTLPILTLRAIFNGLGILVGAKALLCFAGGWGLLQRESWARPLVLVLGVISLLNIPLGTALGIYTLWVFIPAQSAQEYSRLPRAA